MRAHGPKKWMSYDFIEKAREAKPDVLITEGTRIEERERGLTELQVEQKIKNFISKNKLQAGFLVFSISIHLTH